MTTTHSQYKKNMEANKDSANIPPTNTTKNRSDLWGYRPSDLVTPKGTHI